MGTYTKCQKGFTCCWCVKVIYDGGINGTVIFTLIVQHSGWKNHGLQTQWIVSKSLRLAIGRIRFLCYKMS